MRTSFASLAMLVVLSSAAAAQTINFDGVAPATCTLAGAVPGVITLGSDLTSWGTTTPGAITATNTSRSNLTVTRGGSWSTSPAGTPTTTFTHQVGVTGNNTLTDSQFTAAGNAKSGQLTSTGVNVVTVAVSASASAPYPAGTYQTQVTVTCAPN